MSNHTIHTTHEPFFRYLMAGNALSNLIEVATMAFINQFDMTIPWERGIDPRGNRSPKWPWRTMSSCWGNFWHICRMFHESVEIHCCTTITHLILPWCFCSWYVAHHQLKLAELPRAAGLQSTISWPNFPTKTGCSPPTFLSLRN